MDFRFTEEEERFREEIRSFLREEFAARGKEKGLFTAFYMSFIRKLVEKGWTAVHWPKEYGGQGWPIMRQVIFNEEMAYHRAPRPDFMGLNIAGPAIIGYGTPEQKKQHLPPIVRQETLWCQGFTEPQAGSDLASLQTRAMEDGDDFIMNGQKTYTTMAHYAQWCILLARTDPNAPKHRGISCFLVEMKTPGITVRPLIDMAGQHTLNEVFLDDVRVPKSALLGDKNMAWYQAAGRSLESERSSIGNSAAARRLLEEMVDYTKDVKGVGFLQASPILRQRIAEMAIEIEIGRMLSYRVAWLQSEELPLGYMSSLVKLYHSELSQRLVNVGMQILGLYGPLERGSKWAQLRGRIERLYLVTVSNTFGGGTSEIQRLIIATKGLGLPREPVLEADFDKGAAAAESAT